MKRLRSEKGITLSMLLVYVMLLTIVIGLLAAFTSYMYPRLSYINSSSISYEEFNKFNVNFIADCKECRYVDMSSGGSGDMLIRLYDTNKEYYYYYNSSERAIYRNNVKIAKNICRFYAREDAYIYTEDKSKTYIEVSVATGRDQGQIEYEKTIQYVLRYWN